LVRAIVGAVNERAPARNKTVEFVIASNLALLTDEILEFCRNNSILLSTSLDGPADLHNRNRPRPGGNSHELAVSGIRLAQTALGRSRVGARKTTTEASLSRVEEIVDEYLALDLDGIFLRPLSPYGFAIKTKQFDRYGGSDWLAFYERGLRYIIEVNRSGRHFPEFYATLLLKRMLSDQPIGYVDLRSPAGIGLGALVYNYDGKVFASDEGRMLAEMGDRTFELGDLRMDNYRSLVLSEKLVSLVGNTLAQCAPQCSSCAYEPHCGAEPVYHHATQGDAVGIKPLSEFCARQKGVLQMLFEILDAGGQDGRFAVTPGHPVHAYARVKSLFQGTTCKESALRPLSCSRCYDLEPQVGFQGSRIHRAFPRSLRWAVGAVKNRDRRNFHPN
jgi:His-Xaa-Ser system radical SAM maturase HxsB